MSIVNNYIEDFKKNTEYDSCFYDSLEDQYLNGDCEQLVFNLAILTDFAGEKIRIYQNECVHYVYKYNDIFYDIRGPFNSIREILFATSYYNELFEEETEIDIDNFNDFFKRPSEFKEWINPSLFQKFSKYLK